MSILASPSQAKTIGSDAGTKFTWSRLWFLSIFSRITACLFPFRFIQRMLWIGIGTPVPRRWLGMNKDSSVWLDCCIMLQVSHKRFDTEDQGKFNRTFQRSTFKTRNEAFLCWLLPNFDTFKIVKKLSWDRLDAGIALKYHLHLES